MTDTSAVFRFLLDNRVCPDDIPGHMDAGIHAILPDRPGACPASCCRRTDSSTPDGPAILPDATTSGWKAAASVLPDEALARCPNPDCNRLPNHVRPAARR